MGMPPLGMGQGQPTHESGEFTVHLGADDEVEMVGHETIGEELDGMSLDGLAEDAEEGVVAVGVVEDGETCVTPVEGMIDQATFGCSR
jgi:hypothetical protein